MGSPHAALISWIAISRSARRAGRSNQSTIAFQSRWLQGLWPFITWHTYARPQPAIRATSDCAPCRLSNLFALIGRVRGGLVFVLGFIFRAPGNIRLPAHAQSLMHVCSCQELF